MEIWVRMRDPFGRYEISDKGNIRKRVNEVHPERKKNFSYPKPFESKGSVRVSINGGQKVTISRMVYDAFISDLEDGFVIAHLNGDHTDNRPENLAQVSQMENIHHKKLHGTWQAGPKHPSAKCDHSYEAADRVRAALASARRSATGRLAKGERPRIASELKVDIEFLTTVAKGGWVNDGTIHRD